MSEALRSTSELRGGGRLTLFLWIGANVVRHSLQRVEEHVQVGALNLTPHEELQVRPVVLPLPTRPALDVEKFGFERLGGSTTTGGRMFQNKSFSAEFVDFERRWRGEYAKKAVPLLRECCENVIYES